MALLPSTKVADEIVAALGLTDVISLDLHFSVDYQRLLRDNQLNLIVFHE